MYVDKDVSGSGMPPHKEEPVASFYGPHIYLGCIIFPFESSINPQHVRHLPAVANVTQYILCAEHQMKQDML